MIILAEAISQAPENGLHRARVLPKDSPKRAAFQAVLDREPVAFFLKLHEWFAEMLNTDLPLVLVTDWSDPCEVVGLRLETEHGIMADPGLCFLGFYTDWDSLETSGIEDIFGHELSHLWLHWMGYDPRESKTNRFHTCTAITDPYLAFAEGFAEHLEIVSRDRVRMSDEGCLYDQGYDLGAWVCERDGALRRHAVKNNRFLYLTVDPEETDFDSYAEFHAAHNTSSAFLPERLKNGSQVIASEGVIASFFYQMYRYAMAGYDPVGENGPMMNLYRKILSVMARMDLTRVSVFADFVSAYMEAFPEEREEVLDIFGHVTNYVTVSREAAEVFGEFYRIGRLGNPERLRTAYPRVKALKERCRASVLSGELRLDAAVYPQVWITGEKEICPVPWEPQVQEKLRFDVNTATAVDFYSLEGLTFVQCRNIERHREQIGGFRSEADFYAYLKTM